MAYLEHVFVVFAVYSSLALSLNLLVGEIGRVSLAHGAMFGLGAYFAAITTSHYSTSFQLVLLGAVLVGVIASLSISLPSFCFSGDNFVIVTFCFQMIFEILAVNIIELTGGPLGISGIQAPPLCRWRLDRSADFVVIGIGLLLLTSGLCIASSKGRFGRVMHGVREDERLLLSYGYSVASVKVIVAAVSSGVAAVAGAVYAFYLSYIDPGSFDVMESVMVLAMVVIGGAGSIIGPILGALIVTALPEALRFLGVSGPAAAASRQVVFGIILLVCMLFRRQGLVGKYDFLR